MRLVSLLACVALLAAGLGAGQLGEERAFEYAHAPEGSFMAMVDMERRSASEAATSREAERWALTLSLLLEFAYQADRAPARAYALDAVLAELVASDAWGLLASLSAERRTALWRSLARFDVDDPADMHELAHDVAQRRIRVIDKRVMQAADSGMGPTDALGGLLARHGWAAPRGVGPRGRQRAQDRPEFRSIDRHDVAWIDGLARRHLLLPPTEVFAGVPVAELERKLQRTRNFSRRIGDWWTHQDGPRLHDAVLDASMRDATGIIRLVHADTTLLAHHDRMRRWRLREALWRLGGGA